MHLVLDKIVQIGGFFLDFEDPTLFQRQKNRSIIFRNELIFVCL